MREFLYKYGLIIFLMISISVLAYQKEANENKNGEDKMVPDQTVVISAVLRSGMGIPVIIKKGLLNPENEGKKWITLKDFMVRSFKRNSNIDNKNIFEVN